MNTPSTCATSASFIRLGWIFGARGDLTFLFLPVFLAVLLFAISQISSVVHSAVLSFVLAQAIGLSPFHVGSTWFHYFDKANRAHYMGSERNRRIFIIAPGLVFLGSVALAVAIPALSILIFIAWSLQHLVRQNTGILLLYHNSKAGEAIPDRRLELNSQYASNIFFALIFANRILLSPKGNESYSGFVLAIIACVFLVAAVLSVKYLLQLQAQIKQGSLLNLPALCFWFVSIFWLAPLAFLGHTYYDAVLIPNVMHFAQYIGLNYQLVKNKYTSSDNIDVLPIKQPVLLFVLVCLGMVVIYNLIGFGAVLSPEHTMIRNALIGAVQGFGNVHYFQDAFIWRFREEFNRKAFLPYLKTTGQPA